jgi:anti-anti-sigma regulatory factor
VPPVLFLAWIIFVDASQPIADLLPIPPAEDADPGLWPPNLAVYRLRCASTRRGAAHRLPNMQTWFEELDPSVDVAVIDLGDASDLESAGAEELCIVADRMHRGGKALVVAGVDDLRHPTLRAAGLKRVMPVDCIAPDLDSALKPASERAWRLAVRSASRPTPGH